MSIYFNNIDEKIDATVLHVTYAKTTEFLFWCYGLFMGQTNKNKA